MTTKSKAIFVLLTYACMASILRHDGKVVEKKVRNCMWKVECLFKLSNFVRIIVFPSFPAVVK
jgi:hypothetical protein